jgi:hypothetical protein
MKKQSTIRQTLHAGQNLDKTDELQQRNCTSKCWTETSSNSLKKNYLQAAPATTGSHARVPEIGTALQLSRVRFSKGKAEATTCGLELTNAKSRKRKTATLGTQTKKQALGLGLCSTSAQER